MIKKVYSNLPKIFLYLSISWIVLIFFTNPHYVESTQILDNWFTANGLILYKDIAEFHFPLGRWIILPLHLVTNWNIQFDPFVAVFTGILTLITIYLFGKRFLNPKGTIFSLLFFGIFFWFFATNISFFHEMLNGLLHTIILFIIFTFLNNKISFKKLFILGLLFSTSLLVGQIAVLTIITEFILTVIIIFKKYKIYNRILKTLLFLLAGTALPIIIISLYFYLNNAFSEFFRWNITYYFQQYTGHQKGNITSLPLKELFTFIIPIVLLAIFMIKDILKRKKVIPKYIYTFFIALSTLPFIFFSIFHFHHISFALPILAITLGVSFDFYKNKTSKVLLLTGIFIILLTYTFTIIPWHWQKLIYPSLKIYNDTFPGESMYEPTIWIKENTPLQTKIMVIGDPLFYFRSNRLPPVRPSKGLPHGWEPFNEVKKEILSKPAPYWVVSDQFMNRLKYDYQMTHMVSFIEEELKSCYSIKKDFNDWKIYERTCK